MESMSKLDAGKVYQCYKCLLYTDNILIDRNQICGTIVFVVKIKKTRFEARSKLLDANVDDCTSENKGLL